MTSTCDKGILSCNHQNHCQAKKNKIKTQKLQLHGAEVAFYSYISQLIAQFSKYG